MKNDKFLLGIIIGIIVLVIAAVTVVLTRAGSEEYVADDTPAGVVHNYYLALQREEYEKAYSYLSDELESKPTLDEFILAMDSATISGESALSISETTITGNRARVNVTITTYRGGGLLDSGSYSRQEVVHLRAVNGQWKIVQFPYPYWGYDWNKETE